VVADTFKLERKTEDQDHRMETLLNEKENVRTQVWDFGGQESCMPPTSSSLPRRLYLLVLNGREAARRGRRYWAQTD